MGLTKFSIGHAITDVGKYDVTCSNKYYFKQGEGRGTIIVTMILSINKYNWILVFSNGSFLKGSLNTDLKTEEIFP